ncbi:hypothetical protein L195_g032455, partial [Trifolium pratense]
RCSDSDAQVSEGETEVFDAKIIRTFKCHDEQLMLIIPVTAVTICASIVTVGGSNVLSSVLVLGLARKLLLVVL